VGQLVICRLLQGALTGTIAASVALVASVVPDRRSGFALGMMQTAVFLGVSLGPLVGGFVADAWGYRTAFRVGAALTLVGGCLVWYGTDEQFEPPDPEADDHEAFSFRRTILAGGFLTGVLVMLAIRFSNSMSNPAFPLVVRELLDSVQNLNSITGSIVACAAVAGALSAAVLGHLSDRLGNRFVLVSCSLAAAASSLLHAWAPSLPWLYVARICFGLSVAGMMPAANSIIRAASHASHIGKAYGAATALSMAGIALGPYVGGTVAAWHGLRAPFVFTAAAQLCVALLVAVLVRPRRAETTPESDGSANAG
jgi:DHA1 family multidrug resistance protein-like MFS transporter